MEDYNFLMVDPEEANEINDSIIASIAFTAAVNDYYREDFTNIFMSFVTDKQLSPEQIEEKHRLRTNPFWLADHMSHKWLVIISAKNINGKRIPYGFVRFHFNLPEKLTVTHFFIIPDHCKDFLQTGLINGLDGLAIKRDCKDIFIGASSILSMQLYAKHGFAVKDPNLEAFIFCHMDLSDIPTIKDAKTRKDVFTLLGSEKIKKAINGAHELAQSATSYLKGDVVRYEEFLFFFRSCISIDGQTVWFHKKVIPQQTNEETK